jgi:hypothetical protein
MVSTAQEVGAALGLAIIATAVLARSAEVTHAVGRQTAVRALARTAGFQRGALVAAGLSIAAALAAGLLLRRAERTATPARLQEPAPEPARRAAYADRRGDAAVNRAAASGFSGTVQDPDQPIRQPAQRVVVLEPAIGGPPGRLDE